MALRARLIFGKRAMAKSDTKEPTDWPGFEIAIAGEGLSPAELPVRVLVELLQAATKLVEEIADSRGVKLPQPSLTALRTGSAAYDLRIRDYSAGPIVEEARRQIKNRAKDASPPIRRAVRRLHDAGSTIGSVRFSLYKKGKIAKALFVATPLDSVPVPFDVAVEMDGTVVGVMAATDRGAFVKLRLDDGALLELRMDPEDKALPGKAASAFQRRVVAVAEYETTITTKDADARYRLLRLHPSDRTDEEFMTVVDAAREAWRGGVKVRATDWLRELDE